MNNSSTHDIRNSVQKLLMLQRLLDNNCEFSEIETKELLKNINQTIKILEPYLKNIAVSPKK